MNSYNCHGVADGLDSGTATGGGGGKQSSSAGTFVAVSRPKTLLKHCHYYFLIRTKYAGYMMMIMMLLDAEWETRLLGEQKHGSLTICKELKKNDTR